MTDKIQSHLNSIQEWLDRVDQATPPAVKGLSPSEKQQLQTVNRAIEQLSKLGVTIPSELRTLKLSLSAKDVVPASNAQHINDVEALIERLKELSQTARTLHNKLKPETKQTGDKKHFGVTLKQLLDSGYLSTEDRLEHQRLSDVYQARILRDGSVSAKTEQGWKTFDSLSSAASELIGRGDRNRNGWKFWRRINPDGTRVTLATIRDEYLNQAKDS